MFELSHQLQQELATKSTASTLNTQMHQPSLERYNIRTEEVIPEEDGETCQSRCGSPNHND